MSVSVHLLGRPRIERAVPGYRMRSRKSWALLAYLLLGERPPPRSQLAGLLFAEAADPLRALRWSLAELRRALGDGVVLVGDPVVLQLPRNAVVDVEVLARGSWQEAVVLPGLGSDLLDGVTLRGAPAFESWLLVEQRRLAGAAEAILHEAAVGSMSHGELDAALAHAGRLAALSPFDENHHALLIRLYRMAGDDGAAERQLATCTALLERELGVAPGPGVQAAMRESRAYVEVPADEASIASLIESGTAAVSAGATEAGADSLRTAVRLADGAEAHALRVRARLVLAETLIHATRGRDEEGVADLLAAGDIALAHGDRESVAEARAELGYVDFLRGRYARAEMWLRDAREQADGAPWITAKAATYLGSVESDRADYGRAAALLEEAVVLSRLAGDLRREAFATSMLGRVHLLRGELDLAAGQLDAALAMAEQDHWLAFLPWPQALRGSVELERRDVPAATALLEQAFARACRLGDPCWEGLAVRGLALAAEAGGDADRAFALLADALVRTNRVTDPYLWLDGYILDARCSAGLRHGHPATATWVESLHDLASRTGMRELTVRALRHAAALGAAGSAAAADLLAADIDNPLLATAVPGLPRQPAAGSRPATSEVVR